jgi:hypothetical protein
MDYQLVKYEAVPARRGTYDGEITTTGSHRVEIRDDEGHYRFSIARSYLASLTPKINQKGGLIDVRT